VIETQIQPEGAIEHADPPLDPRPKPETTLEPTLLLVSLPLFRKTPALGQNDSFETSFLSLLFVLG
jgi:hypothetical protein